MSQLDELGDEGRQSMTIGTRVDWRRGRGGELSFGVRVQMGKRVGSLHLQQEKERASSSISRQSGGCFVTDEKSCRSGRTE